MTAIDLPTRARNLNLHGLLAHLDDIGDRSWVEPLLAWEEDERARRSQERRLRGARLGRFKPIADFDWSWPTQCDRAALDALLRLDFMRDAGNAVLMGPNGVGKTTIARNIAHQAVLAGHTVLFTTAGEMLNDLAAQDGDGALKRRLNRYVRPALLLIDEVGYLSYGNRHADLLFEIISRRYEQKSTLVTTNRPFSEWGQVFPNAPCVVSLIDRLIHHAEIIAIEAESYRLKEARERASQRQASAAAARSSRSKKAARP
jgi:DNA replication protein DnaC